MTLAANVKKYYNFNPNAAQKYGAPRDDGTRKHRGTDISHSAKEGTLVPALITGKVTGRLKADSGNDYGNQIRVQGRGPDNRLYNVSYSHGVYPQTATGTVKQGDHISTEGRTGETTGSCMHLEVYDIAKGVYIDPMILVKMVLNSSGSAPAGGPYTGDESTRTIQKALNTLGYNLEVDGLPGPKTTAAIKDFQKEKGLVVDGFWGPKANTALNKVLQKKLAGWDRRRLD